MCNTHVLLDCDIVLVYHTRKHRQEHDEHKLRSLPEYVAHTASNMSNSQLYHWIKQNRVISGYILLIYNCTKSNSHDDDVIFILLDNFKDSIKIFLKIVRQDTN